MHVIDNNNKINNILIRFIMNNSDKIYNNISKENIIPLIFEFFPGIILYRKEYAIPITTPIITII